jgi:hypothetical protein
MLGFLRYQPNATVAFAPIFGVVLVLKYTVRT